MNFNRDLMLFLHFGYVPRHEISPEGRMLIDSLSGERPDWRGVREAELVERGAGILKKLVRDRLSMDDMNKTHVIPLSGGLDSRAVLAGLLDNIPKSQIMAVTFGAEGSLDLEIGRRIAEHTGIRHHTVNLGAPEWVWREEVLLRMAVKVPPIAIFESYVNHYLPTLFGVNAVYWSGFSAGFIAGSRLPIKPSETWDAAIGAIIRKDQYSKSPGLLPPGCDLARLLPEKPFTDSAILSYDDQVDFFLRQSCFIRHAVLPVGYDYRAPFLHPEWVRFMMTLPAEHRQGSRLYKKTLCIAYPELFGLPTKNNGGLPLTVPDWRLYLDSRIRRVMSLARDVLHVPQIQPGKNKYVDFDQELRKRSDLKKVVLASLDGLRTRGDVAWVDAIGLWNRHQALTGDYSRALLLLAGAELFFKAGRFRLDWNGQEKV